MVQFFFSFRCMHYRRQYNKRIERRAMPRCPRVTITATIVVTHPPSSCCFTSTFHSLTLSPSANPGPTKRTCLELELIGLVQKHQLSIETYRSCARRLSQSQRHCMHPRLENRFHELFAECPPCSSKSRSSRLRKPGEGLM